MVAEEARRGAILQFDLVGVECLPPARTRAMLLSADERYGILGFPPAVLSWQFRVLRFDVFRLVWWPDHLPNRCVFELGIVAAGGDSPETSGGEIEQGPLGSGSRQSVFRLQWLVDRSFFVFHAFFPIAEQSLAWRWSNPCVLSAVGTEGMRKSESGNRLSEVRLLSLLSRSFIVSLKSHLHIESAERLLLWRMIELWNYEM